MRILHTVESYYPSIGGMQEVVRQLSERLAKLGHEVVVAARADARRPKDTVINGVRVVSFSISGNLVNGISGGKAIDEYQRFLQDPQFDVISNFAAQQWATDLALPLLGKIHAKKVFVPTGFSGFYLPEYQSYFENMKSWMPQYDMNVFLSEDYRDINFARSIGVERWVVIPNGAGADEFERPVPQGFRQQYHIPAHHRLILHVGSHTGVKGHREAIEIFRRANIQNATLLIVGNALHGGCATGCARRKILFQLSPWQKRAGKQVLILDLPREQTVAAYQAADLFLFPSNIECSPIVLFECMAARTPFLTADVGNSAEIIQWSEAGQLLPTDKDAAGFSHVRIKDSARLLEDLLANSAVRETMAVSGYDAWKKRFSWEVITRGYERMYQELLETE